jgi:GNAT superfamily N-acetyltransferase
MEASAPVPQNCHGVGVPPATAFPGGLGLPPIGRARHAEGARGRGIGRALLDEAVAFCRRTGRPDAYLWTFAGLDAARRLYDDAGFLLVEERAGETWGKRVTEQRFLLRFG